MELHGSAMSVQEEIEMVSEIAHSNGALKFEWESDHEKRAKLWRARHEWWYGGLAMQPGKKVGLCYLDSTTAICKFLCRDLPQMSVYQYQSYLKCC